MTKPCHRHRKSFDHVCVTGKQKPQSPELERSALPCREFGARGFLRKEGPIPACFNGSSAVRGDTGVGAESLVPLACFFPDSGSLHGNPWALCHSPSPLQPASCQPPAHMWESTSPLEGSPPSNHADPRPPPPEPSSNLPAWLPQPTCLKA